MTTPKLDEAAIFSVARQIKEPEARRTYLQQVCGEDRDIQVRVEALLRVNDEERGFLASPAEEIRSAIPPSVGEGVGTQIGPYKLVEQIGEGVFGAVYMAEQLHPVRRKVALKVLKAGMDTRQVVARFEAERQALAIMDHPNIAKVFDGGSTGIRDQGLGIRKEPVDSASLIPSPKSLIPDGRPYFVMELVKGVPITKYCDEHQLTPRERLALFVPVCQAIQHAHHKGIIHRDVKPSNVLVALYDDRPVPKVIDFGVAKATGQRLTELTLHTGFAAVVGTLEYMSPEQASFNQLDVDTRSDICSLGVLLYELLTGSPPFTRKELEKAGMMEMLRVIREQEPSKPSTKLSTADGLASLAANRGTEPKRLTALVRGELDRIVMKSLEKDRNRRYETANGLAQDIERYLADEVVQARPPSAGYRLRKFVRRNKGRVVGTTALALTLLAGVAAVLTVEAKANHNRAAAEADRVGREAGTTASVAEAVREARERALEAWNLYDYPDRMQQATAAALAAFRRADGFVAGGSPTAMTLAELASARQVVDELARHTRLITACAGNSEKFADDLGGQKVLELRAQLANGHGEAFRQFGLDLINDSPGEVAKAVAASRLRDALLGRLLEWHAQADFPAADPVVKDRLWQTIGSARQLCGGAFARWQDLLDRKDIPGLVAFAASPTALSFRSTLINALGRDLASAQQYSACRTFLRAAVDRYPHDVFFHYDLYKVCLTIKPPDPAEGLRHISAASALRPDSGLFRSQIGDCYTHLELYGQAIDAFRRTIALRPDSSVAYQGMGHVLLKKKDMDGAISAYRESVRLMPKNCYAQFALGGALIQKKDWDEAITAFRASIGLRPNYPPTHFNLGIALQGKQDLDGAITEYREAIRLQPRNADAHFNLGIALQERKDWGGAIAAWREAIRLRPEYEPAHVQLGTALMNAKRPAEAREVILAALRQNPAWADNPRSYLRYDAACCAMNSADGKGAAAPPPAERPMLRKQALDILTADLALLRKLAATDQLVHEKMQRWMMDADLASVRDPMALEMLPPDERDAWRKLWADVRDLRDRTRKQSAAPQSVK